MDPKQQWLGEAEAAAYIGFTPRFLQARRARGDGPRFSRVSSRAVRYSRDALDEWMESREKASTSEPDRAA